MSCSINKSILNALKIYDAAIQAANPYQVVKQNVKFDGTFLYLFSNKKIIRQIDLSTIRNIVVIGAGKATALMAKAVEEIFGPRIFNGHINVNYNTAVCLHKISLTEASHPIPGTNSLIGTQKIFDILKNCNEKDLVICLFSGGGSSLLENPIEGIHLKDLQKLNYLLIRSGASIQEINAVRQIFSTVKGGRLLNYAFPAMVLSLIISDVIGDPIHLIASGPTIKNSNLKKNTASNNTALFVLKKYNLLKKLNIRLTNVLKHYDNSDYQENGNVMNHIIANNTLSLNESKIVAVKLGYQTKIVDNNLTGETKYVAKQIAKFVNDFSEKSNDKNRPYCFLFGGETTVKVRGKGRGGRNQEMALSFLQYVKTGKNVIFLSCDTDGIDGLSDVAGAVVSTGHQKSSQINKNNLYDYLEKNNSYQYFTEYGGHIFTGQTHTNVMDMQIILMSN